MEETDLDKLSIAKTVKTGRTGRRKRKSLPVAAVLIGLLVLAGGAWMVSTQGREVQVTSVSTFAPSQLLAKLNASGYVVAQRKADVAAKITGQLVSLMVKEGSIVKQGQIIARLESQDAGALVEQSRANLTLAQAREAEARATLEDAALRYERLRQLAPEELVSKADLDSSRAAYLAARAAVEAAHAAAKAAAAGVKSAEIAQAYTEIRAPFDAVVLTKNADIGDIVTPMGSAANSKAAVVSLADLASLQVEADVAEANIGGIRAGQPCDITLDALPNERFEGLVDMIVPTVDRSKATVMVKVRFRNLEPRILPGMSAKVGFLDRRMTPDEAKPRLMIAASSVRRDDTAAVVFKVAGAKVLRTPVRTGLSYTDMVEVLSGLHAGDRIVSAPDARLQDGDRVRITEK